MDQEKIGKFIAACRKEQGMTQAVLAEQMGITDRAISKWENGHSLPDASIMPQLCELLDISLTELFTGERIAMENYKETTDALLLEMKSQEETANKRLLNLEKFLIWITLAVTLTLIIIGAYLAGEHYALGLFMCIFGTATVFVSAFVGVKIEQDAGYYECPECKMRYVPTYRDTLLAPHIGTSRKMKCPYCGHRAYHKKVLTK